MATNAYYLNQFISTTLSTAGGIDDSQTTGIKITSTSGVTTDKPGILCLSYSDPIDTTKAEWISYTSIDVFNELQGVTRGAEGFSAKAHANGVTVAFPISESHINNLNDALIIDDTETNLLEGILDEDDMASDSATKGATQQSIKAYSDSATQTLTNKTLTSPVFNGNVDGWISANETWEYVSADDPTFTFKIAGVDLTSKYSAGMRIKLTQTTVKYFIVTAVAFSTDTTITVYGGTDYNLENAVISLNYYSAQKAPQGFPLSPSKWSIETYNNTVPISQSSPTKDTWYNLGTIQIVLPIGSWFVGYKVPVFSSKGSAGVISNWVSLSTSNNSVSNNRLTQRTYVSNETGSMATFELNSFLIEVTSKTTYYLIAKVSEDSITSLQFNPGTDDTVRINVVCAYL